MTNTVIKLTKPYTKINDISTFKCIYALTKEVENYTGPCIRVERSSDNEQKDIYFNNDGTLDTVTLLEFCGSSVGSVVKWYDQLEFSDFVQATIANAPTICSLGSLQTENGVICATFDNTNDYMTASVPYATDESIVSLLALYTRNTTSETDFITAYQTFGGVYIANDNSDKTRVSTIRSANNTAIGTNAVSSGTTILTGAVVDRTDIKLYEDGVLDTTVSDSNTDFVDPVQFTIGANTSGGNASGTKYQFIAVSLNDESDNMAEYYTQLSTRYDTTLVNEDDFIYFSDTPVLLSNGYYANGRLVGDINFTESIKVFPWTGINQGGFGNIDIVNVDSAYNSIVENNYNKIDIYTYDGTTLTEFGNGDIDNAGYIEKGRIRITIKSVIDKLNVELPTGRFTASDHADLENEKKQLCLGRANLVEPTLIDVSTNEYFVKDDLYNTAIVYDEGISSDHPTTPVLFTTTTTGFKLTANPTGRVLCTVDGFENSAGTDYEKHISEHIPRLLKNIDIEYDDTGLSSIYPAITSTWSGTDESVLTAINELLDGFISYMYADSTGELQFGTLELPASKTGTLEEREIIGEIKKFKDRAQGLSERLQNSRNYNPYAPEGIAFGATESDKINLVKEYKRTSVLSGLHPFYKNKNNVDMKSQSLGGITNGETILQDIIDLWSEIRYFYTLEAVKEFDLNQVITVTHSQKGLESGKDLVVIEKKKSTLTNKIQYKLWG